MSTTKQDVLERLSRHDWSFEYSDDSSSWKSGQAHKDELLANLRELGCPFSYRELYSFAHTFVDVLIKDGFIRNHSRRGMAPLGASEIITLSRWQEIADWFEEIHTRGNE